MLVRILGVALAALALTGPGQAQLGGLYRLNDGSFHTSGCLPPCACPISLLGDVRGTFRLTPISISQFEQRFEVEEVHWTVIGLTGTETVVKGGKGLYTRTSLPTGVTQQLEVVLSIDGGPDTKFDSGPMPGGGTFPDIDIPIADNGFVCLNQVFDLRSSPVPASDVTPHVLMGTTYQEGCFPPCLCPITLPVEVVGRFDLVVVDKQPFVTRHNVVNLEWKFKGGTFGGNRSTFVTGTGSYKVVEGLGPLPQQSISLCLAFNGVELAPFTGGPEFFSPANTFAIVASQNGMVCFDRVFDIMAKPQKTSLGGTMSLIK
jgi:hypothetical protein